ncbi:MAG TPA: PLP-dependent aminotransferase family protein [Pyrinomonadaceae bacterium]|nr:PLP-dependent aminotransferase family protein [Pyrinomonadaceae bacterium]
MTTLMSSKNQLKGGATLISVDRRAHKPIYKQIYAAFRARIVQRELRPGQLVPSTRELARELRISRFPVLNAYAQLLAEGYFESRVGAGTFIASSLPEELLPQTRPTVVNPAPQLRTISAGASTLPKYVGPSWTQRLGPFQVGQPELQAFPLKTWSKLVARHSRNMRACDLQYGDAMGAEALREAIAIYLRTSRGVRCEADQIMIVSGSQQALDITARVLLNPGAAAWVEEPGYWLVHHVLKAAGCKAVPVPVDLEGLDVSLGIELCSNARAAFVAPSHQYPLGVTMSATRRLQLLTWAQAAGSWIIEDDYDSEYRYESPPISSLQGLDTNSRVIYIGTFSKILFPSLRLGYIVIPPDLVDRFAAVRQSMDLCPPSINQAVLTEFIREGHFARHIRKMRQIYGERRRVLVKEIERELYPSCTIVGGEAGMHLTILTGGEIQDNEIVAKAAERKLQLSALSLSYVGDAPRQGFVLGFGNTHASQIPGAVRLLKKLLKA